MKFLVCKKQSGEGCDYTIGCGYRFEYIEADSIEAVIHEVVWPDGEGERSSLEWYSPLETILIVPAEQVITVDVNQLKADLLKQRREEEEQRQKDKELQELKRLQEKYDQQL